jgi:hypothetical protein
MGGQYEMNAFSGELEFVKNMSVINAADEEDLTAKDGLIQIKDRGTVYGKGYKILRRGVDLQSQLDQENTIYEIRYNLV